MSHLTNIKEQLEHALNRHLFTFSEEEIGDLLNKWINNPKFDVEDPWEDVFFMEVAQRYTSFRDWITYGDSTIDQTLFYLELVTNLPAHNFTNIDTYTNIIQSYLSTIEKEEIKIKAIKELYKKIESSPESD